MDLQKRNCGIEMRLVPYGAGWTDVHLNIGSDQLYFIISSGWGDQFSELLKILYHLHPQVNDQDSYNKLEYWDGICEFIDGKYKVTKIVENRDDCHEFFEDLCTINELISLSQRLSVAKKLYEGKTFTVITAETGASSATIGRVNKCLSYGTGGYRKILDRLSEKEGK